jgi:DNA-binding response OmpR family regulator
MFGEQKSLWRILFIDDDEDDYIILRDLLSDIQERNIELEWASSYQKGLKLIRGKTWDAILVDYDLGVNNGVQLIENARDLSDSTPFIMVTGRGSHEKDVEAMNAGASEYVTKSELSSPLLERVIRYAIQHQQVERELERRVTERTEALMVSVEEMKVLEEELRTQFEQLSESSQYKEFEHYKDLFEYAPGAYLVTNPRGIIEEANLTAVDLFNYARELLIGKPLSVFIARDFVSDFRRKMNRLMGVKALHEWDLAIQPFQKEQVAAHLLVFPRRGKMGEISNIRWLIYI